MAFLGVSQIDFNPGIQAVWMWGHVGTGPFSSSFIHVIGTSNPRPINSQLTMINNGFIEIQGEAILVDSAMARNFVTPIPVGGRNVPYTASSNYLGIAHYGDGTDEKFDVNRFTTFF